MPTNWSEVRDVAEPLGLEDAVFRHDDPQAIAARLKQVAETDRHARVPPYRTAMATLTLFINRAGDRLSARRRMILDRARVELRKAFGR